MGLSERQRNKVMLEAGHACAICERPHVQVHHIDGNNENNDESNLIVLCANHHAEAEMSKKGRGFTAILSPDQLRLYKEKQKQELAHEGRVKEAVAGQVVLPVPPMPYLAHPYPLQKNFTGRLAERKELTEWFTKGEHAMFAYVAIGGMGKSALTWYWLHEDIIKGGLAPEGIIWWSFYDREASFDSFLRKSIQYTSKGEIDAKEMVSVRDGMDTLYTLLSSNGFLLVLDGVERVLRAYAGLGSPYQGDAVKEDERQDFRASIDPNVGTFLQWLASSDPKTRTLLTTRLCPKELDDMAGCFHMELREMSKENAVEFFHRQGVKGTRAEIETACDPFGYHPLCLRLLSGMIVEDPQYGGDVNAWTKHNPLPDLKGEKQEHHILELAYNSLDPQKQVLLSKLSAFRNPMAYDALSIFNEYERQEEFDKALIELAERGLLLKDTGTHGYDLHPIVRRHCYDRLRGKKNVHSQLRDYFAALPHPEKVESLDDLAPVIELYHHTVNSRQYDEACDLFYQRIDAPTHYQLGAHDLRVDLLSALFPDGEDKAPRLKEKADQAWTLAVLGISYSFLGQLRRSMPLKDRHNKLREKAGDRANLATGLMNLSLDQIWIGEFESAESNLRREIEIDQDINNEFKEAIGHRELGRLLAYRGEFKESRKELAVALRLFTQERAIQSQCIVWAHRALRALLSSDAEAALKSAKKAFEIASTRRNEVDRIRAGWLLGAAYLAKAVYDRAEERLNEALVSDRRINLVSYEPDILLNLGKLRLDQGRGEEALKLAQEALGIADRCEYRLKQADIHNFLAEFYLGAKDFLKAKEHVEIAKERAACGYKPAMDKAEALAKRIKQES